ncbi:hypothetical protein VIGAN_11199400 [Vigna angularis var. angularis]|uniref:Uncharacterized protein n=1 Tax=Vigna angularis var. angularis TaxID=157739 RepID=A0A0S3TB74_PHAAN|nr:hypothetical protein VIGAN_11199400 [Vigna angularis var. angularis]
MMLGSVLEFITQAASSSAFIFCFCNLIIVIILMTVSIRVTVDGAGPINSGECVFGAAIRICHGQERGKVMLLEVAFVVAVTGDLEFPLEGSVLDDEARWRHVRAKNWEPTRNEGEEGDGAVDRDDLSVATNMTEPV